MSVVRSSGQVTRPTGWGPWVKQAFTHNVGLKLLAIVLSVGLFSLVHGAEDAQRSVWVDVVALLPPEDANRILVSQLPERVRLIIKGRRSLVNNISSETLPPVSIDLTDGQVSRYSFYDEEFDLPAGVSIVLIDPASLPLEWAGRVARELPVTARIGTPPGEGLALGRPPVVEPDTVRVSGPEEEVAPLLSLPTEVIDLGAMAAGRHVERVALERFGPHVQFEPDRPVRVTLDLVQDLADRNVEGLAIETVGGEARLRPERVSVALRGPPSAVDLVDPAHLVPYVDLSALGAEAGAVAVPVELRGVPDGVEVTEIEPAEVLVNPGAP